MKKQNKASSPQKRIVQEATGLRENYAAQPVIKPRNADGLIPVHLNDEFNTVIFCNTERQARRAIPLFTNRLKKVGRQVPIKEKEMGPLPDIMTWWELGNDE
jgi:hypothetical protein